CTADADQQSRLMAIARRADPDEWRDRARDPSVWKNRAEMAALIQRAPLDEPSVLVSVQLLVALADRLQSAGGDSIEFLKRVQKKHPADFWANFSLATVLTKKKSAEAVGYFRAALAIRPDTAAVYEGLGSALRSQGRVDEAIEEYRRAIQVDPKYASAY